MNDFGAFSFFRIIFCISSCAFFMCDIGYGQPEATHPPADARRGEQTKTLFGTSASELSSGSTNATVTRPEYDTRRRMVQIIPPGTVIADSAPKGWSHLVIKSHPVCTAGDFDDVAKRDIKLSAMFSNVFLVNITEDEQHRWIIRNIGFGITVPVDGRDVVVAPKQEKAVGAKVGILGKVLLKEIDFRQRRMPIRVLSPHFAIVDAEAAVRHENNNQQMILRYALVADPLQRQLHSFVWLLQQGRTKHKLASKVQLLPPSHVEQCNLHVDKSHYSWGIPNDLAFAAVQLPQGTHEYLPANDVIPAMQRLAPTINDAGVIDRALRRIIASGNSE